MARLGGARRRLRALRLAVRRSRERPGRRSASRPNRSDQRPRRWRSKRWHASAAQRPASQGYCKTLLTFRCPLADGRVCSEGLSVVQPTVQTLSHPCSFESRRRVAPSFKPIACAPSSDAPHSRGLRSNFARLPHPSFETSREGWLRPLVCRCDYFGRADICRTLDCTLVGTKAKNRPLSVLREGYWTAYGDREAFRVGILEN